MITIQDNIRTGKVCSRHDVADLLPIANKPIGQLCEENEHLLVFPMWRKRSIPTHSGWLYPLTFDAGKGLKEA